MPRTSSKSLPTSGSATTHEKHNASGVKSCRRRYMLLLPAHWGRSLGRCRFERSVPRQILVVGQAMSEQRDWGRRDGFGTHVFGKGIEPDLQTRILEIGISLPEFGNGGCRACWRASSLARSKERSLTLNEELSHENDWHCSLATPFGDPNGNVACGRAGADIAALANVRASSIREHVWEFDMCKVLRCGIAAAALGLLASVTHVSAQQAARVRGTIEQVVGDILCGPHAGRQGRESQAWAERRGRIA
jgi:hypothetical protein